MARRRSRRKHGGIRAILWVILIAVGVWLYPYVQDALAPALPYTPVDGEMSGHVVDVGQADAILLMTPDGNMLIDAGTNASEDELAAYLGLYDVESFEYVVFTHPHSDHIGGADMIMRNYAVKNVILPDAVNDSLVYTNMLSAIEESDAQVIAAESGAYYNIGDMSFRLLAPNSESSSNLNDTSVVLRATYGAVSMMFTGDAE